MAVAEEETADRVTVYTDAVFAVIVTIMVLELKAPDEAALSALLPLWPTLVSYAVSYLFIAIIWINHHYLMRFVGAPTPRLIWINFIHLFMVSLLPFATAWVARTRLASIAVALYAGLFVCIDIAYNVFERHILSRARDVHDRHAGGAGRATHWLRPHLLRPLAPPASRRRRYRSMTTSRVGHAQQTSTLPLAGSSSGSGP